MLKGPRLQGQFRTDDRARAAYAEGAGIYRIVPAAVAVPEARPTSSDWSAGRRSGTPLVARGAGVPWRRKCGRGRVVDLTALGPARLEVHAATEGAGVRGITAGALDAAARSHGLRFPRCPERQVGHARRHGGTTRPALSGPERKRAELDQRAGWVDAEGNRTVGAVRPSSETRWAALERTSGRRPPSRRFPGRKNSSAAVTPSSTPETSSTC
jgi:hypothetical protein